MTLCITLAERQRAFRAEIVDDDEGSAPSSIGMAIYRDAYRSRLLAALDASFERTRRWVGAESFNAAACHYVLTHPPRGWTLDDYGAEFPALLEALFGDDPEVHELAWLEWHMQRAFAAPDAPRLDPAALAASGYGTDEWDRLGFRMAAGFADRAIATNCTMLWEALAEADPGAIEANRSQEAYLIVWRSGVSPRFRVLDRGKHEALQALVRGGTLGDLSERADSDRLAPWLAQWFGDGLFASSELHGA